MDITKITQAMVVVTESQHLAIFLEGDIALPESAAGSGSVKYYEPSNSHGLLFADVGRPGLVIGLINANGKAILEGTLSKEIATLAGTPRHQALAADLKEAGEGVISIGLSLGEGPISAMARMQMPLPLDSVVISISEDLSVVLRGEPAAMKEIQGMAQKMLGEVKAKIDEEMATLGEKETGEGIVTIILYHIVSNITQALEPKVDGGKLTLFVEDLRPLQIVPLAAIAIPQFMSHIAQSKVSEPIMAPVEAPVEAPVHGTDTHQ
jgi:hypothetical protein